MKDREVRGGTAAVTARPSSSSDKKTAPDKGSSGASRPRHAHPQPRRVTARGVEERRDGKPIIFNYGAHLTRKEKEAVKERIAYIALIVVGVIVVLILAGTWVNINVIQPAQPVATVNGEQIRTDTYNHMTNYVTQQEQAQYTNVQNQLASLAPGSKNDATRQYLQQYETQLQQQLTTVSSDALTRMEQIIVLRQGAQKLGIVATPKQISDEKATIIKQLGGQIQYNQVLASTKMSDAEYQTWVVEPSVLQPLVTNSSAIKVSPYADKTVDARHILVSTQKLADSLASQIEHGANFAALARKYSTDKGSAVKGGELGYFGKGQMVAPFENAAFSMKVGEVRVVHSQFGWHVIQVTGIRDHQKLSQSDLSTKRSQAFDTWLQQQLSQAKISPASAVPASLSSGSSASTALPTSSTTSPTSTGK